MHPVLTVIEWGGGTLPLGSYGALLTLALLLGTGLCVHAAARAGLDAGACIAALALAVGAGLAGADALFVALGWLRTGSLTAALSQPGLVFYGGAAASFCALVAAARALQLPVAKLLDLGIPALPIAQAVGRVGCFLGGCCYGAPYTGVFAVRYTHALAPAAHPSVLRHAWPLYDAALLLLLAAAFASWPRARAADGERFAWYALAYACERALLEPLRGDALRGVYWSGLLSTSQLVSGLVLVLALAFIVLRRMSRRAAPDFSVRTPGCNLHRASMRPSTLLRPRSPCQRADLLLPAALCAALLSPWLAFADVPVAVIRATPARIAIEAGWFEMGSSDAQLAAALQLCQQTSGPGEDCDAEALDDERPAHAVHLSAFSLDRTEVSNAAYWRCVAADGCAPAASAADDPRIGRPEQPVVMVSWAQAAAYCAWQGGALPTEAQWERAARGGSARSFPWGSLWNSRLGNHAPDADNTNLDGYAYAAPVDAFPDGRSFYGVLGMAGNVWEWVADHYAPSYAEVVSCVQPQGPSSGAERVIRGGSWRTPPTFLRVSERGHIAEHERRPDVGFRCAYPGPIADPVADPMAASVANRPSPQPETP